MIKIGIIGIGRTGSLHLEKLLQSDLYTVVGCFDADKSRLQFIHEEFAIPCFENVEDLISECDALDIASSVDSHLYYCELALRKGKHIFLEKPLSNNLADAKKIMELVLEAGVKFQIGHIDRFNPAFTHTYPEILHPTYIEVNRLKKLDLNKFHVDVVFDLMLNDIDLILKTVKANIKSIKANGSIVLTDTVDIANARIEFDNGCIANLTASRIGNENRSNALFYQKDNLIEIDFLNRTSKITSLSKQEIRLDEKDTLLHPEKKLLQSTLDISEETDMLRNAIDAFAMSLYMNKETAVTIHDAYKALEITTEILAQIHKNLSTEERRELDMKPITNGGSAY